MKLSNIRLACAAAVAALSPSGVVVVVDAFVHQRPLAPFATRVGSTTEDAAPSSPAAAAIESSSSSDGVADFFFANSPPKDVAVNGEAEAAATTRDKTPEERSFLRSALLSDFETKFDSVHLNAVDVDDLVDAFEKITVPENTEVCVQGEVGDYFYVIERGGIQFVVDGEDVGAAGPGQSFGELALLYDCPRAATCLALTECELYRVDRSSFREVLYSNPPPFHPKTAEEDAFLRDALTHDRVLDAVQLEPDEIDTLVGAFERRNVKDGEDIVVQGGDAHHFYVIESGDVKFIVDGVEVGTTGEGRTFGELALLFNAPRAATVRAYGGDVALWIVDRHTFRSVLGGKSLDRVNVYSKRVDLKKRLEKSTLLGLSGAAEDAEDNAKDGEDIMRELETIRPVARPAFHCSMNGDWCMVKAGVNTLDMTLITVLSTVSRLLPSLVDFEDCYITLSDSATLVTCNIFLKLFGAVPFRMNAYTALETEQDHPEGTLMYESFQGASVMGIDLPLPKMSVARPLEITYLDEDVMIARNDGGEPHLLVRIRNCPDEDPDHKFTGFFEDARLLYGDRITRCLVDRGFGKMKEEGDTRENLEELLREDRGEKCPITGNEKGNGPREEEA